jgi:hypothetical protein
MRALLALCLASFPLCAQTQIRFEPQVIQRDWGVVYAVTTADVNKDGKPDIVAINPTEIAWFENPSWTKHVVLEGQTKKDNVAVSPYDVDRDGILDFAIAADWQPTNTESGGSIGWVRGAAFGQGTLIPLNTEPTTHRIRWGDIDGDGRAELVVAPLHGRGNKGPDWQGQGARILVFRIPAKPSSEPWPVEVADESLHIVHNFAIVDGEIWTASREGVHALRRLKNGSWTKRRIAQGSPGELKLGTLNTVRHLAAIEPWHGDSLVVFQEPHKVSDPNEGPKAQHAVIPDKEWERTVVDSTFKGGHAVAWADLDGDGSDELVAGWRTKPWGLAWYKRDRAGKWARNLIDGETVAVEDATAADLDGDGLAEVIAVGRTTQNVVIFWNRTQPAWKRNVVATNTQSQTAVAADFTGDGRMDIIAADNPAKRVILFPAPDWKPVTLLEGVDTIHAAVMDVNRDGQPDFIGARYAPGYLYALERPKKPFTEPWKKHIIDDAQAGGINGIHGLTLGDVNRDGTLDVIGNSAQPGETKPSKNAFPNALAWFDGKRLTAGTGKSRHVFAHNEAPGLSHYFGFGDVNKDGLPDIATAAKIGGEGNWFAWWEQPKRSGEPWKKHLIARDQPGATNINMVDVNRDGRMDFLATRGHGRGLVWFEAPDWRPHSIEDSIVGPHALATGDIDDDGDVDAVTCAKDSLLVAWFENDGQGAFTTHPIYQVQSCYDIRLVDMDGDKKLDVLVAGRETGDVVWYRNQLRKR